MNLPRGLCLIILVLRITSHQHQNISSIMRFLNAPRSQTLLIAICAGMFVSSATAADDFILGKVASGSSFGELRYDICMVSGSGTKFLAADVTVVLVGEQSCTRRYSGATEHFFEIAYRGKRGFIKKDELFVIPEDLSKLAAVGADERALFAEKAVETSKLMRIAELSEALKALEKMAPKGVALLSYGLHDVSEYTEGTGFSFRVANPTKKTIKYVTASIVGLNPVKDPVRTLRGATTVTLRGVGPIGPDEDGSYSWDYVWHTDLTEYVRWVSLKVEYTDGTTRTLSKPQEVLIDEKHMKTLLDSD